MATLIRPAQVHKTVFIGCNNAEGMAWSVHLIETFEGEFLVAYSGLDLVEQIVSLPFQLEKPVIDSPMRVIQDEEGGSPD